MKSAQMSRINLLATPAIVIVAVVTQVPLIVTVVLSLLQWIVVRPDQGISFIGLTNYLRIFGSREFFVVLLNTVILTLGALVICTVLGLGLALLLNRSFPGVNIVRTLMIAPFFVMDAVAGIIWKTLMLHPSFGFNGLFASWFKMAPVDFLGTYSLMTVLILVVWQWTPFFVLLLLAGLQGLSPEILDSARVDGASWFLTLIRIKIPSIAHHIEVAVMLGLIFILKVFGLIYVTTAGGPGESSTNLPYYVYRTGFYKWDVGKATATAVITVLLTLVAIMALFRFVRARARELEA